VHQDLRPNSNYGNIKQSKLIPPGRPRFSSISLSLSHLYWGWKKRGWNVAEENDYYKTETTKPEQMAWRQRLFLTATDVFNMIHSSFTSYGALLDQNLKWHHEVFGAGKDVQSSLLLRRDLSGDQEEKWWLQMKAGSLPYPSICKQLFKNSQERACIVNTMELHSRPGLSWVVTRARRAIRCHHNYSRKPLILDTSVCGAGSTRIILTWRLPPLT